MTTQTKNECNELECKILQIKELAKELDEDNWLHFILNSGFMMNL